MLRTPGRLELVRVIVIVGLIAGFALSPRLWLNSRVYPLTPVWAVLPFDRALLIAAIAALVAVGVWPRRAVGWTAMVLLALLAIQDQSRWQPWFYLYLLLLVSVVVERRALNTCCVLLAATYFWSGLSKLSHHFLYLTFPWLLEAYFGHAVSVPKIAAASAVVEACLGLGLLFDRWRAVAIVGLLGMHAFILGAIGPFGHRFNTVVWPWNVVMMALVVVLFWRKVERLAWPPKVVIAVAGLLPLLSFFGLWDHYLSFALYSGNRTSGVIRFDDAVFKKLPAVVQEFVTEEGPNVNELDIHEWSYGELNVPSYPEVRIYRNVLRTVCRYAGNDPSVELVVTPKRSFFGDNPGKGTGREACPIGQK